MRLFKLEHKLPELKSACGRLSNTEKRQLVAATKRRSAKREPAPRSMPPRANVEFATFAARFGGAKKPVRFVGDEWKL